MRILVFAPHNDDEVLGAGGTIARFAREGHEICVCEVTSGPKYMLMQAEAREAHKVLGVSKSVFLNLPVSQLADYKKTELNARIGEVVSEFRPDMVFTPFIGDMHLDHRMVTEAVLVAVRPINNCPVKKVCMYETLSETGWNIPYGNCNFNPNIWVDISGTINTKIEAMNCYVSQVRPAPHPRSGDGIRALAAFRGSVAGLPFAESFMIIREII